ncbi:riboflavin synthase domain-like protein [Exidia glandulosa HHB12029]|uniref:NADPH-dependent diflavin oxidoreductase 1 n=1 Tax=Exidia glandulosa HHB12029 TaxID=1314781 RepID=A0A165C8Y4_EXIGL|nr:riboflavin synthase domain-like protein [Exidia glandulosa HHB12029]
MTEHFEHAASDGEERILLVLYATETGNSLDIAERVAREARRRHFHTRVTSMDDYPLAELINEHLVIFVLSTTGAGQEPRPMAPLWNMLLRSDLPNDLFDHLDYAVFGLGDSSYEKFNWAAKKLARRLESLGARHIIERGEGDEQHRLGIDGALDPWMQDLFSTLLAMYPIPNGLAILPSQLLPPARVHLEPVPAQSVVDSTSSASDVPLPHHHFGVLVENKRLTAEDWTQDVRHLSIKFEDDISYAPGDVALLYPQANADDVETLLARLGWHDTADSPIRIRQGLPAHFPAEGENKTTLREVMTKYVDIAAVPRRSFFEWIRHFTSDEQHKEKLEEFCTPEGQEDLYDYVHRVRRTILEVLLEFKSVDIPPDYVFDVFPLMRPRMFSIASSLKMHPKEVQLCIAIVQYRTRLKTPRRGVCTSYLARLPVGTRVQVGFQKGTMRPPDDASTPILCVGPGTGVAPMRALVEERIATGSNRNTLYFGCRSARADQHYADEWAAHEARQALTYRPAFSRDAPSASGLPSSRDRVYVQDVLRHDAQSVWEIIGPRGNGVVYIAGSAGAMPRAVRAALVHSARAGGGLSEDEAQAFLLRLERENRLFEEGWN